MGPEREEVVKAAPGPTPAPALAPGGPIAAPAVSPGANYLSRLAVRPAAERAAALRGLGNQLVARSVVGDAWSSVREYDLGIDIHLPDASDAEKLDWIRTHQ